MMKVNFTQKLSGISLILLTLSMSACSEHLEQMGLNERTVYPAVYPRDIPPPPKSQGTIFQDGYQISLFNDRIASRIGDILTVRLEVTTQGQKKTKTKSTKVASNDFQSPTLFGGSVGALSFETDTNQQFDGEGEANQQNRLQGTISVTVTRVLSNSNLVVQGESWVTIDQGREFIRLTGIVRPEDIEPNNLVSSQRVADARIVYSGNGYVADSSRPGILTRILNKFFPY